MRKSILSLLVIMCVAVFTQGCQQELEPEKKCNFVQNSYSRRVSWFQFPIRFYADKSMDDFAFKALEEAAKVWNESFRSPVFELLGRTDELKAASEETGEPPRDGYNAFYMIMDGAGFGSKEQARTTMHNRGDYIHETDVIINGKLDFFIGTEQLSKSEQKVELVSLLVHELGHVLGLDHIDEEPSVMQSRLDFGEARRTLQPAELDSLACEY